jgi:hypothetical protein
MQLRAFFLKKKAPISFFLLPSFLFFFTEAFAYYIVFIAFTILGLKKKRK